MTKLQGGESSRLPVSRYGDNSLAFNQRRAGLPAFPRGQLTHVRRELNALTLLRESGLRGGSSVHLFRYLTDVSDEHTQHALSY
jgi:hypothetical protein